MKFLIVKNVLSMNKNRDPSGAILKIVRKDDTES